MNPERLLQHFDRISEAPDAIPRLRRFILDLAVRGKLVEQDPSDEPVAELLKRIEMEKARLVRKGNIKEPEAGNHLPKDELPYDVPDSWIWIPFSDLISHSDAGVSPKTEGFSKSGNAWGF
jgi:type I restriction enzyme, S subunit